MAQLKHMKEKAPPKKLNSTIAHSREKSKNASAIPRYVTHVLYPALFVPLPGQTHNKIMFDNVCDMGTPNSAL